MIDRLLWDEIKKSSLIRIQAGAVADATGLWHAPGMIILSWESTHSRPHRRLTVVHAGPPAASPIAPTIDLPDDVVMPGFVNAHTHLDLTLVGPRQKPETGSFSAWLADLRDARPQTPDDIRRAVRRGIDLSMAGGVVAVGDIAGCTRTGPTLVPWQVLRESPLLGTSFLEFFAIGAHRARSLDRLEELLRPVAREHPQLGLQPHAPYSVSLPAYQRAAKLGRALGLPMATHLAETAEEREFIERASGPQRALLEELGLWDDDELEHIGRGQHPVEHLEQVIGESPWLVAHAQDCPDKALEILARCGASVAYCPRASEYFNSPETLGPHRYCEMQSRGINVCFGTDSIINLESSAADEQAGGMSPLDDARLLFARDGTDPATLLGMLTTHGARALQLDSRNFAFVPGVEVAGVVAVRAPEAAREGLGAVFSSTEPPRLIAWNRDSASEYADFNEDAV